MDEQTLALLRQFHGHLGPWVTIGLRLGRYGCERLGNPTPFQLQATVRCAEAPPESCLLDGVQFSTGCTLGKRNIEHCVGGPPRLELRRKDSGAALALEVRAEAAAAAVRLLRQEGEVAAVRYVLDLPLDQLAVEQAQSG